MRTAIVFFVALTACSRPEQAPLGPRTISVSSDASRDSVNALLNAYEDAHADRDAWKRLGPAVRPQLVQLLNDPNEAVTRRARAAEALSYVAGPAERALLETTAADRSLHRLIRMGAVSALANAEGTAAVAQLIGLLEDPERGVRARAIDALARLGTPAARSALTGVQVAGTPGDRLRAERALSLR